MSPDLWNDRYLLYKGDCLEVMPTLQEGLVKLVLCDLPYGTISCKWDEVIPFNKLWPCYTRLINASGAIVLFGQEPFSSLLRLSNLPLYKYDWIWRKTKGANVMQARNAPLKVHELISVFSKGHIAATTKNRMDYNPQGLIDCNKSYKSYTTENGVHGYRNTEKQTLKKTNYPNTILAYDHDTIRLHPTQKPVNLLEYLIKTYTNENDVVLDNTMGSGSTGVACMNIGRRFVGIEQDSGYFDIAVKRINEAYEAKT